MLWCRAVLSWFGGRQLCDSFSTLCEIKVCCVVGGVWSLRRNLEGIDGRAPPGAELAAQFASTRENSPGLDTVSIDRLLVFLDSTGGAAWPFLVGGVLCLGNSVNEPDISLLNYVKYDSYLITSKRDRVCLTEGRFAHSTTVTGLSFLDVLIVNYITVSVTVFFQRIIRIKLQLQLQFFILQKLDLQWLRPGWYSTVEQISGYSDRERHGGLRHAGKGLHQGA